MLPCETDYGRGDSSGPVVLDHWTQQEAVQHHHLERDGVDERQGLRSCWFDVRCDVGSMLGVESMDMGSRAVRMPLGD